MKNCGLRRISVVIGLLGGAIQGWAQDPSPLNGPRSDLGNVEENPNPDERGEEDDLKHNTKSQYDYDVRKNILTGTKTYIEKAEGEVRVGNQKYRQKYHHKRKISKNGKVLSDEEVSRTYAE